VVAELGLTQDAELGARDATEEARVEEFLDRLTVDPVDESRLVQVSYESHDPTHAAEVVNAVFDSYLTLRAESNRSTVGRLARQADSVRAELTASERRLNDFVRDNELFMAQAAEGATSLQDERLRQLQEQLTTAETEHYAQRARWAEAQGQGAQALGSRVAESLSVPLAELQAEYARLRATFTDDYPKVREVRRQIAALEQQLQRERARVQREIGGEYRAASQRLAMLRNAFEEQKAAAERLASLNAEYSVLKRDTEGLQTLYTLLGQKQKEADVSAAMALTDVRVIDAAVPPTSPVRPLPKRNLPLAALAGLVLGVCAALLREYADPKVRRAEELESMDVPILAMIPSAAAERSYLGTHGSSQLRPISTSAAQLLPGQSSKPGKWVRIDREDWRRSALAEGFGNLRTSVLFSGAAGAETRSLLVTSAQAGEGKTTVSMNLAISLARLGRRVLLIDADLRRPSLHRAFAIAEGPGLAEHLAEGRDWRECAAEVGVPNLRVIPSGAMAEGPSELLSTERMRTLLAETQREHDFVVVDSPALMVNVADARILSSRADAIVLVVRGGVTPREVLRKLLDRMPNVVGVVLNDLEASEFPEYYQDYRSESALNHLEPTLQAGGDD
jgi:capsular exopolysaccharide synthesis family protein